jgi:hypothetical protein
MMVLHAQCDTSLLAGEVGRGSISSSTEPPPPRCENLWPRRPAGSRIPFICIRRKHGFSPVVKFATGELD